MALQEVKEVKNDFTKGPMWQVILKMSIPMMMAQLVNVLYNVVDRMYIGHIEHVGAMALTGLGLSMPVISLITASPTSAATAADRCAPSPAARATRPRRSGTWATPSCCCWASAL